MSLLCLDEKRIESSGGIGLIANPVAIVSMKRGLKVITRRDISSWVHRVSMKRGLKVVCEGESDIHIARVSMKRGLKEEDIELFREICRISLDEKRIERCQPWSLVASLSYFVSMKRGLKDIFFIFLEYKVNKSR